MAREERKGQGRGLGTHEAPMVIPGVQQAFSQRPHPADWSLPVTLAFRAGLIVGTKSLQQLGHLLWYMVHEDLAIAFHIAFCLLKRQLANVPKGFLIVLWRGTEQNKSACCCLTHQEALSSFQDILEKEQNSESRVSSTLMSSSWIFKYHS